MTLNQVIELFKAIGNSHMFLNSTEFGNTSVESVILEDQKYPAFFQEIISTVSKEQTVERTFKFRVFDLVYPGKENQFHVLSDTEQTLTDIIKVLRQESDHYTLLGEPTLQPFQDKYGDAVSGWEVDIVLETIYNSGYCDIPWEELARQFSDSFNFSFR
jgi:hypothetical protein